MIPLSRRDGKANEFNPRIALRRILWFVALWGSSVIAIGMVGYAIKLVLK